RKLDALEDDDRDLPVGLALVLLVVRPDAVHQRPEPLWRVARRAARAGRDPLTLDLHPDLRRLPEVPVPARVLGGAALRRDDHRVVAVEAEDQRGRALVPRRAAGRRQEEDRGTLAPDVALFAVGLAIAA